MSSKLGRNPFQKSQKTASANPQPVVADAKPRTPQDEREGVPATAPRIGAEFPSLSFLGKALLWGTVDLPRRILNLNGHR